MFRSVYRPTDITMLLLVTTFRLKSTSVRVDRLVAIYLASLSINLLCSSTGGKLQVLTLWLIISLQKVQRVKRSSSVNQKRNLETRSQTSKIDVPMFQPLFSPAWTLNQNVWGSVARIRSINLLTMGELVLLTNQSRKMGIKESRTYRTE
jgi:hypothetical protein